MIAENKKNTSTPSTIEPFKITQALVGLALDREDDSMLQYFDFFTKQIPTSAAYFIHVIQNFDLMTAMYIKDVEQVSSKYKVNEILTQQLEEQINTLITEKEKMYIEYDVIEGNPLEEMLASAADLNIDLLVIGQKKNKINHNILAKNLARKTTANALIIPEDAPRDITNILVPIDFSSNAVRALQAAISLHKQLKAPAQITCLNVYSIPSLKHFRFDAGWIQTKKTVEANIKLGFEAFLTSHAGDYKDRIEVALVEKTQPGIATYIMDYANEKGCDFLCLGAKGYSKVHLLLMGSVTEEVLDINHSIPTMIVK